MAECATGKTASSEWRSPPVVHAVQSRAGCFPAFMVTPCPGMSLSARMSWALRQVIQWVWPPGHVAVGTCPHHPLKSDVKSLSSSRATPLTTRPTLEGASHSEQEEMCPEGTAAPKPGVPSWHRRPLGGRCSVTQGIQRESNSPEWTILIISKHTSMLFTPWGPQCLPQGCSASTMFVFVVHKCRSCRSFPSILNIVTGVLS